MKNADMPAMPILNENGAPVHHSNAGFREGVMAGLTKREMFAMHISGHVMVSLNRGAGNGEWEYPGFDELANQSVKFADALLAELEK